MKKLLVGLAALSMTTTAGVSLAESVSVEGTLVVVSKDDFTGGQAQTVYLLQTATTTYRLELSGVAPNSINENAINNKVRVSGDKNGNTIKVVSAAAIVRLTQ